jgi:hypothetical protein
MTKPSKAKYDKFIEQGGLPLKRWGLPEDVGKLVKGIAAGMLPLLHQRSDQCRWRLSFAKVVARLTP